ncbi:MAG: hypothetical protein ACREDR_44475, partial [Blastocatellia bacterium]
MRRERVSGEAKRGSRVNSLFPRQATPLDSRSLRLSWRDPRPQPFYVKAHFIKLMPSPSALHPWPGDRSRCGRWDPFRDRRAGKEHGRSRAHRRALQTLVENRPAIPERWRVEGYEYIGDIDVVRDIIYA